MKKVTYHFPVTLKVRVKSQTELSKRQFPTEDEQILSVQKGILLPFKLRKL